MQHIDFVIWMIFFPFFMGLLSIATYKSGRAKEYDEGLEWFASAVYIIIWFYVGWELF
jgi:hypothetical protein